MRVFNILSKPRIIWVSFILTLLLTISFGLVMKVWNFILIDEMMMADQISSHIANMSEVQRRMHVWTTATLDVAYPFAYASLFIGLTVKAFEQNAKWLTLPAISVVPVDLAEGWTQVMLLSGHPEYVHYKIWLTPSKLVLFIAAFLIAVVACVKLWKNRSETASS